MNDIISDRLTPHDIKTVLHRLDIKGISRKDSGWITIKSPLREEKKPSFSINLDTGAYKDHGTGDTGDIVTLVKRVLNEDNAEAIQWIKEVTDLAGLLYGPAKSNGHSKPTPKKQKPQKFWGDDKKQQLTNAQELLKNNLTHNVIRQAKQYDQLTIETLNRFGAGIWNYYYVPDETNYDWLALPYRTGVQLYRRADNEKVMYAIKGSKPAKSFFGSRKVSKDKKRLFLAKSPRECMLLWQLFTDRADVIGLATGEQESISNRQRSWLRSQISASNYSEITILLDCNNENAESTAKALAMKINELAGSAAVSYVNIHQASEGQFKDITDCTRAGMSNQQLWDFVNHGHEIQKDETDSKDTGDSVDDAFDISTAPPVPDAVYDYLPEMLKTRCSLLTKTHRKDVFLISALPVIAAQMPNVLAGHVDGYYSPDLFTLIVAGPGTGKGVSSKAKAFGHRLNEEIIKKSEQYRAEYESAPGEEKMNMELPKDRSLFIPANSSSRAIYDTIQANGGNGLLFENEIDTMLNATSQEWGNFSDICRKAFHHESISINRKKERFYVDNPRLSICLSGTFGQFKKMFASAENGYFSRYGLYTFDAERVWQSHRPTERSRKLIESVQSASKELYQMHQRLTERDKPLYIDLTDSQWQMIDDTFSQKMQIIEDLDLSSHLHASNNRAAVLALRMASMFTVLRAKEEDSHQLVMEDSLTPTGADINAAILLADNFIKHAIPLYYILPKAKESDNKGQRYKEFISALPEKFETAEAKETGKRLDIPPRTVEYWLSNMPEIKRVKRGKYELA